MESVTRFWSHEAQNIRCVREADFDRVTAERDALQQRLTKAEEELDLLQAQAVNDTEANTAIRAERDALQLMLNDREEQNHSLEQRRHAEQQVCQAAERRVEKMEDLLRQASMLILDAELLRAIDDALNSTAEAVSHE